MAPNDLRKRTVVVENGNAHVVLPPVEGEGLTDHLDLKEYEGRKLVGVDGYWYDVTSFTPHHPGGPIIEQYIGRDASAVFHAYGHEGVLQQRKPVGTYQKTVRHPADEEFEYLTKMFTKRGYFKTDAAFYVEKIAFVLSLWLTAFCCVLFFQQWYMHYFGAVVLAFFFQQCGFTMHEFHHSQVFRKSSIDRIGGMIFGTIGFGISSHWWRDEHIVHHAMTNTVDLSTKFVDPQMYEALWAQNEKMFPLFDWAFQYIFIKIQHFTFVPVVVLIGRIDIVFDSFRVERRWYEWMVWPLHWLWVVALLYNLPSWKERVIFYCIASWVEGIFHFQLILSHYCKAFKYVDDFHASSWFEFQILSNMNIDTPKWQDWYYGGLNFHIEHHLFPKMARKHLREVSSYVREVCKKHNIDYDMCSFGRAMVKTLTHLKATAKHYKLDPR